MASRGLDHKIITHLHDVVERRFSKISTQFGASFSNQAKEVVAWFEFSLTDRDKDRLRKALCICLWS